MNKIKNYIIDSVDKSRHVVNEYHIFNNVPVFVMDELTFANNDTIEDVINKIEETLPEQLIQYIDIIYIGDYDVFHKREVNAVYQDGAIYVINIHDNVDDMVDDIIHEIAHATEEKFGEQLYFDGNLENEFLTKRIKLFQILKAHNEPSMNINNFANLNFDLKFDKFLYQEIGYPKLSSYIAGLFYSPYSVTSIREYFASGFETFFVKKDVKYLQKISPVLYSKIEKIALMS